jgi:hypothetical protein
MSPESPVQAAHPMQRDVSAPRCVDCGCAIPRLVRRTRCAACTQAARRAATQRCRSKALREQRRCVACGGEFFIPKGKRREQVCCSRRCGWNHSAQVRADRQGWHSESPAVIEAKLEAARAARLAEERRQGQRRYTIETGWMQRSDATSYFERDGVDGGGW